MARAIGCPRAKVKGGSRITPELMEQRTRYSQLFQGVKKGYITRAAARYAIDRLGVDVVTTMECGRRWMEVVFNESIGWDVIDEAVPVEVREDGYDLTVPGANVFMLANQLIVWDTMSVHVPVTQAAVDEARERKPSDILFSAGNEELMLVPGQSAALGLYLMSKKDGEPIRTFANEKERIQKCPELFID